VAFKASHSPAQPSVKSYMPATTEQAGRAAVGRTVALPIAAKHQNTLRSIETFAGPLLLIPDRPDWNRRSAHLAIAKSPRCGCSYYMVPSTD
jgi:hypothetical protein